MPALADCRQERQADLDLAGAGETTGTQILCGMGGVGKTQLAVAFAERVWERRDVDLLVWVAAGSRASILSTYARAAARVTGEPDPDTEQGAERFLTWLREPHGRRWLVVVDDLVNPVDIQGMWPPATESGRTVVTTRRRDSILAQQGRMVLDVGMFTADESLCYLDQKLGGDAALLHEAPELARDLGWLPLALAQAAAYILDRGLNCAEYRERLADQKRALADVLPEPSALPDGHHSTVAATWSMSIEIANGLRPAGLAEPMLRLASLLDANAIPATAFTTTAVRSHLADATAECQGPVGRDDIHDALHNLSRLHLVGFDRAAGVVSVHGLVQRVVRESIGPRMIGPVAIAAADALVEIWPAIENDRQLGHLLRDNADALRTAAGPMLWDAESGAHALAFAHGESLGAIGLLQAATRYYEDLLSTALQCVGPTHRHTLVTRNNLAYWQGESGDLAGAAASTRAIAADMAVALGPDDPDTLRTRQNAARWRGLAGDPAAAAAELIELLPDFQRVFGPDDVETLQIRHNAAEMIGASGDAAGAREALGPVAAAEARTLGVLHPKTLVTRRNLAFWRGEVGDPAGAAEDCAHLLTDMTKILGSDHPEVLQARALLAHLHGNAGNAAESVRILVPLLSDRLRVLGPDHPDTLGARLQLARRTGEAGDAAAAAASFHELVPDQIRVLGPEHPDTLSGRYFLVRWTGEAGDPVGAVGAAAALLQDFVRLLGADHPYTLTARGQLAYWYGIAGDALTAAQLFEQLASDMVRILGADHPDTLATRAEHAKRLGEAGDPAGAAARLADVLPDLVRVLGPDHPRSARAREDLAKWTARAGDLY